MYACQLSNIYNSKTVQVTVLQYCTHVKCYTRKYYNIFIYFYFYKNVLFWILLQFQFFKKKTRLLQLLQILRYCAKFFNVNRVLLKDSWY